MKAGMLKLLGSLLLGIGLLAGILLYGKWARNNLQNHERYQTTFADVQCDVPSGMTRKAFLLEVQYQSELPDHFSILDKTMPGRLKAAFANHAWVATVNNVLILPTKEVKVDLELRQPVLHVLLPDQERVVDGEGVLLPLGASSKDLPRYLDAAPRPSGRTGLRWGDTNLETAAKVLGILRPHQKKLRISGVKVELEGVVLRTVNGSEVRWGSAPGAEPETEVKASEKLARLLKHVRAHGTLDRPEGPLKHDVRLVSGSAVSKLDNSGDE